MALTLLGMTSQLVEKAVDDLLEFSVVGAGIRSRG